EFIPLMKGYENLVRLHANGGVAFNRAMIQFISDNKIEFTERASLLDALRTADADSAGLSNQVFRVLSTYYTNTVNTATLGASGAVFGV
ncbi:hypothetical protein ACSTJJ_23255, partial [Vibrio parahaemolyticus]